MATSVGDTQKANKIEMIEILLCFHSISGLGLLGYQWEKVNWLFVARKSRQIVGLLSEVNTKIRENDLLVADVPFDLQSRT